MSATVNTLVLAYVGAALPILLLFSATNLGVGNAVNFEIVAKEIVGEMCMQCMAGAMGAVGAALRAPCVHCGPSLQLADSPPAEGSHDRAFDAALLASATVVSGTGPGSGQQQMGKAPAAERR